MPEKEPAMWGLLHDYWEVIVAIVSTIGAATLRLWYKLNGTASKQELAAAQKSSRRELLVAQQELYKQIKQCTDDLRHEIKDLREESQRERFQERSYITDLFVSHSPHSHRKKVDE